jgi:hypothetical protein
LNTHLLYIYQSGCEAKTNLMRVEGTLLELKTITMGLKTITRLLTYSYSFLVLYSLYFSKLRRDFIVRKLSWGKIFEEEGGWESVVELVSVMRKDLVLFWGVEGRLYTEDYLGC